MTIEIRAAVLGDAQAVANIYNHAISDRNATFDSFPVRRDRFDEFFEGDPRKSLVVAVLEEQVVGWASIVPRSSRWAYRGTSLGSFFVHKDFRRRHIGTRLKEAQIAEAERLGYHILVVEVLSTNQHSISLNLDYGFRIVGELWEAGYRDGLLIGLVIMQNILKGASLNERRMHVSITTVDLAASIFLYRDVLGLDMPFHDSSLARFGIAGINFDVYNNAATAGTLGIDLANQPTRGLVLTLHFHTHEQLNSVANAAKACGMEPMAPDLQSAPRRLLDLNGVYWLLDVDWEAKPVAISSPLPGSAK